MIMNRAWAMPNRWTFRIPPIRELLERYVGDGKGWIDPFAGESSMAQFTNDINTERPARQNLDALDYCNIVDRMFKGVLFDPPYSSRQVSESYQGVGIKATALDTSANFYSRVKDAICGKIPAGGTAISCGWNSNGFGKSRGFEIIEILLVAHGAAHNDTIVTVERKVNHTLDSFAGMSE